MNITEDTFPKYKSTYAKSKIDQENLHKKNLMLEELKK